MANLRKPCTDGNSECGKIGFLFKNQLKKIQDGIYEFEMELAYTFTMYSSSNNTPVMYDATNVSL